MKFDPCRNNKSDIKPLKIGNLASMQGKKHINSAANIRAMLM